MNKPLKYYFDLFDEKYQNIESIDYKFHEDVIGVTSYASKAKAKDSNGNYSEEYIRTRFVYAMVYSGYYPKESICIEFNIPKGNSGKAIKPDIVVFKDIKWLDIYKNAKKEKKYEKIRQLFLVFFETKKEKGSIEMAVENQLRPALAENESKERVFGIYFDDKPDILIFKKIGNTPIRRYNEFYELSGSGLINLNFDKRDVLSDMPSFDDLLNNNRSIADVSQLHIRSLDAIDETDFEKFLADLKREADRSKPKIGERDLIVEFLTLKVFDEKRSLRDNSLLSFYILPEEVKDNGLAAQSFRNRIVQLYKDATKEYRNVLSNPYFQYDYDSSLLKPNDANSELFLIILVQTLQRRAILKAKNESFNQMIFNNFGDEKQKADKGQFFTPIPVVKAIIQMINPIKGEDLCDPCCGICDFPAMAFRHMHRSDQSYPPAANNFYGFDIESSNLKLAELNLVLNGDGGARLFEMNSLTQKLTSNEKVLPVGQFTTEYYNRYSWLHKDDSTKDLKQFKIIVTNPPFGKGRDLKTGAKGVWQIKKETINLYETYLIKSNPNAKGEITYPKSMDMGALFLENTYKLLEPGGRFGIVLSNSIASIQEWENIRKWLIERVRIVGIFDLPANTFGETGVATTVIIGYKPKVDEQFLLDNNYEVFVKSIQNIGYEVTKKQRTITFVPQFIFNDDFSKSSKLDEDFTAMQKDFKEFMKRQEIQIKKAFNF